MTGADGSEAKAADLMTDEPLYRAYQRADVAPGMPLANAVLAGIQRRSWDG